MITRPVNYLIFSAAVVFVSILIFPFPIRLLEMYSRSGEYDLASEQADIIIQKEGDNRSSLGFMAAQASLSGDPARLIHYMKRLERVSLSRPLTLQRMAEIYMWSGQPQEAIQVLEQKLKQEPGDQGSLMQLTGLYQLMDKPEKLALVLKARLAKKPDDAKLRDWLLSVYSSVGDIDSGVALRLEIMKRQPKDQQNIVRLGGLYLASGQTVEGLTRLGALLERQPDNRAAAGAMLALLLDAGDSRKWAQYKSPLLKALGGAKGLAEQLAQESIAQDRAGVGAWMLAELAQQNPQEPGILVQAVDLYRRNDQTASAAQLINGMADLNPDDPGLARTQAELALESGDNTSALESLRRYVQLDSGDRKAWEQLYQVASWSDKPDGAIAARQLRLRLFPQDAQALDSLAGLAWEAGRYDLAKRALKRLADLKPKNQAYQTRLAELDQAIAWQKRQSQPGAPTDQARKPAQKQDLLLAHAGRMPPAAEAPRPVEAAEAPDEPAPAKAKDNADIPRAVVDPESAPEAAFGQGAELKKASPAAKNAPAAKSPAPLAQAKQAQANTGTHTEEPETPQEPSLPEDIDSLRRLARANPADREVFRAYLDAVAGGQAGKADFTYLQNLVKGATGQARLRAIADALVSGDRVPQALFAVEKLARMRPADIKLRMELAKYYSWTDNSRKRLGVLKELAVLQPDNAEIRRELFEAAVAAGDPKMILDHGGWLLRRGKLKTGQSLDLADAYIKTGQQVKALKMCRSLLSQKASGQELARAGWIAMDQGRPDLARALFGQAAKMTPGNPDYYKNLASAQAASGQAERAVLSMRAYTRRSKDYEAHYMLGEILNGLGRKNEAEIEFEKAYALLAKGREAVK